MLSTFFAKKIQMTGKYDDKGRRYGVTILSFPKTSVLDSRTPDKHGYSAVRLQLIDKKSKLIREIRTEEILTPGSEIKLIDLIKPGDRLRVSGISKGRGFAGVVKRHHFKGGPRTHGQSNRERAPGSSGSTTTPGRVLRGTRRAGHMGVARISAKNLKVLDVNSDQSVFSVIGSVPGHGHNHGQLVTFYK